MIDSVGHDNASRKSLLFGWWYGCIAIGFLSLALAHALGGGGRLIFVPELGIAAGFGVLAYGEFHKKKG